MELKQLNEKQLASLYRDEMEYDFPKSELKPLGAMLRLMEMGQYEPLLVTQDGETVGYAMIWLSKDRKGVLLDYLGVLRGKRNGGTGGKILALLAERYGQMFGEAEAPTSDNEEENHLRRRRIGFYQRNGFRVLDYGCALFGVHFNCLYCGPQRDDRAVEQLHRSVYADYFGPQHMQRYIQLPLKEGEDIHPAPAWTEEYDPLEYERKVIV